MTEKAKCRSKSPFLPFLSFAFPVCTPPLPPQRPPSSILSGFETFRGEHSQLNGQQAEERPWR